MRWEYKHFDQLSTAELYAMLRLRQEVFVVEQNCPYLDADGVDQRCQHLLGWDDAAALPLVAVMRLVPPGVKYAEASFGRVCTALTHRGQQLGQELVRRGLQILDQEHAVAVRISAQQYLEKFYGDFGFVTVSEAYLEDDIPHVAMLRSY